jgi:hypothetical protein
MTTAAISGKSEPDDETADASAEIEAKAAVLDELEAAEGRSRRKAARIAAIASAFAPIVGREGEKLGIKDEGEQIMRVLAAEAESWHRAEKRFERLVRKSLDG